ncbi:MAG: hypothetical protein ACRDOL_32845 [Streptosporangiaceae bacterium]
MEPGIERVQHWATQFPQLHATQGRLDHAADTSLVAFPGGDVQVGDGHVLVEQVAHCGGRLRLLADCGLLQQPGQLGLGVLGCLGGGLEPDLLAGQRVSTGIHPHAVGTARQSLYVTFSDRAGPDDHRDADPEVIHAAEAAAASVPGVVHAHARARWTGRTLRIEIEGGVDPDLTARQGDALGRQVADAVARDLPEAGSLTWTTRAAP